MSLKDIEKKLYKRDSKFERRPEEPKIFKAGKEEVQERKIEEWKPEEKKKMSSSTKKKILIFSIIGFVLVVGSLSVIFYLSYKSFVKTDVILKISGPQELVSGSEASYILIVKNKTKVVLKNVQLLFKFPEDSESKEGIKIERDLGNILPNQEKKIKFDARIFGAKDEIKKISAKVSYFPENINSLFENEYEFKTKIILVPIIFSFNLPQRVANDREFEMSVNIINNSNNNFSDLQVKLDYPQGFTFISSDIEPAFSNNAWFFKSLSSNEQRSIKIKGKVVGADGEVKDFLARLGKLKDKIDFIPYIEERVGVKISSSLLVVFTTVNNSRDLIINAGDYLNYKIKYKNTTNVNIGDVVVKAYLDGKILDLSSLDIDFGYYDTREKAIVWEGKSVPDFKVLGPQKEGELNFRVKVKKLFDVKSANDKNFIVKTAVKIDAGSVPDIYFGVPVSYEDVLELKANSIVNLKADGYYKNNLIINSGPIPPKVGHKTTYTIFWRIINYSNDLNNVIIKANLPANITWENKFSPFSEKLSYDKSTGEIKWEIGHLNAGVGVISPVRQVAFQVGLTPSPDFIGKVVKLLSQTQMKGKDLFTNEELTASAQEITTRLKNDPFVGYRESFVVE